MLENAFIHINGRKIEMPPTVKFKKEEIINAALSIAGKKGIDAVTAREVAKALKVSVGPIFTYYDSMDQLRCDVFEHAKNRYRKYIEQGLREPIPFQGIWRQFLTFAKEEPELYKLLFLTKPSNASGGAMEALALSQDMARESIMRIYKLDAHQADCYFRDIWVMALGFATMIVTDECPFTMDEMLSIGAEVSLSVFKAYREVPGMPGDNFDKDTL